MKIKPIYRYQLLVFLTGFSISLIGVTLEDYNHGNSLQVALNQWHHYLAPLIMGIGMSVIGHFFWVRREHRLVAQRALVDNEYKYRTLYENMIDAVCILDNDKHILDVNQASVKLFESSYDELIGKSVMEFLYKEDKAVSDKYFENLEKSGSYSMYEGRIVTKTGQIKWIQVNSTEIVVGKEKIGSQDIIRDITQRKSVEIELIETVGKLNELNSTKDKLFSIIAHDLRSPFNSILGLSQLLSNQLSNSVGEKQVQSLKTIHTTAQSTLYLLENLLNWAKSQTGQINFHPVRLSMRSVLEDITDILEPSVLIKNITLKLSLEEDIDIFADENMLRSVIGNLVSNAIKFTAKNGNIVLSATLKSDHVEVSIADDGIGIEKHMQDKLFNIETNTSRPGTSNEKGSGLGLVLCKEFIQMHKGNIWVESDGKNGSTFKFSVPIS